MWDYLKRHEAFVGAALRGEHGPLPLDQLQRFHQRQLRYLQQERLVHLIVTMSTALFFLLGLGHTLASFSWPGIALSALLLVLLAAYLLHYFRLENGVQRLYLLSARIDERQGLLAVRYDEDPPRVTLPAAAGGDPPP